jgi:ankyrin repeat protein
MKRTLFDVCARDDVVKLKELHAASNQHLFFITQDVCRDRYCNSLLHIASQHGSLNCLYFILENASFLTSSRNIVGNYPLHLATSFGNTECVRALLSDSSVLSSIDIAGQDDQTALHFAVRNDHTDIVHLLLEAGADPDARNCRGQTSIHMVVSVKCATALLKAKANVNAQDKYGNSVLHQYCSKRDSILVELLLSWGADPTLRNKLGRNALHAACLHSSQSCIQLLQTCSILNDTDIYGWTPLHLTVRNNDCVGSRSLLESGALPNVHDRFDRSPLYFACTSTPSHLVILLSFGADVHDKTKDGQTALHIACAAVDDNPAVHLLLEKGATINEKDGYSNTPLHRAVKAKNFRTVAMLLQLLQLEDVQEDLCSRHISCPCHMFYDTDIPLHPSFALLEALYSPDQSGKIPFHTCCGAQYEEDAYDICIILLLYGIRDETSFISSIRQNPLYPLSWLNHEEPTNTTTTRQNQNQIRSAPIERIRRFMHWKRHTPMAMVLGGSVKDPTRSSIPIIFAIDLLRALILSFL